jgi:hypothetical protein
MTRQGDGPGLGHLHWLAALALLVLAMMIVPVVARFY